MTTTGDHAPQGIWIVSIHDSLSNGCLSFDLRDILNSLGSGIQSYAWIVNLYEWDAEPGAIPSDGVEGAVMTTAEFLKLCQSIRQTFHGEFVAAASGDEADIFDDGRPDLMEFPKGKAELQILALDGACFIVWTKNIDHVRALKQRFRDVAEEDLTRWCRF